MKPMHNNNNNNARRINRFRPNGGGGNPNRGNYTSRPAQQGHGRNHIYDSNGPEGRIRGTAQQVYEKYAQLARDAAATGDNTKAENFMQHAEHYYRIHATFAEVPRDNAPRDAQQPGVEGEVMMQSNEKSEQLAQYEPYTNQQSQQQAPHMPPPQNIPQEQPGFDGFEPPEFLRVKT